MTDYNRVIESFDTNLLPPSSTKGGEGKPFPMSLSLLFHMLMTTNSENKLWGKSEKNNAEEILFEDVKHC